MRTSILVILFFLVTPTGVLADDSDTLNLEVTHGNGIVLGKVNSDSAIITPERPFASEEIKVISFENFEGPSATVGPISGQFTFDYEYLINPADLLPGKP